MAQRKFGLQAVTVAIPQTVPTLKKYRTNDNSNQRPQLGRCSTYMNIFVTVAFLVIID